MDVKQHSDRDLVVLALSGNQSAFSQLMQRHKGSLSSYIQQRFLIKDSVEDLILIVFNKAFRKLDSYDPKFSFSTWLYTIADNSCIDHVRKNRFHKQGVQYAEDISSVSDPESELIAIQEATLILHYINRLKPIYREPIRLRYLHHFAYEEIASKLSLPTNTVKTRLHRAKEILSVWIAQS
jgi:RNA polymerase sigma-70 factor (ECF subfamily)